MGTKSTVITVILIIITAFESHSQRLVKGAILTEKGEPIPYAHITIENTSKGTVSNEQGEFRLYLPQSDVNINITSIGFLSKIFEVKEGLSTIKVNLEEDVLQLNEVTIYSKDYAKELVKKAVENIPKNYPAKAELHAGFIRERVSRDSLGKEIHYVSEAEIEVRKEDYTSAHKRGDVRLVKGRKILGDMSDLETRIYAGAHLTHRFDHVIRRTGPLSKNNIDKYLFDITDTLQFDGQWLFKVHYQTKDASNRGAIFILDGSFAIVKIDEFLTKNYPSGFNLIAISNRKFLKTTTEYIRQDSIWKLSFVDYSTGFNYGQKTVFLNSIYNTHEYIPSEEEIPYGERTQLGQFLLDEVETYDPNFWEGYSSTIPESNVEEFLQNIPQDQANQEPHVINLIEYLEVEYSFYASPYTTGNYDVDYSQNGINVNQTVTENDELLTGLLSNIAIKLAPRWRLHYESVIGFGQDRFNETRLGVSYKLPFSENSRFSISPSIKYAWSKQSMYLETVSSTSEFELGDKKFDASKIDVYLSSEYQAVVPSMVVQFEKSKSLQFVLRGDLFLNTKFENGLFFQEDQNIFRRRRQFIENGTNSLQIS
ncbi:MAG: carboxypeptidase-like regulatory domain-containing protein, partial [Bacteroidota bacterium]